MIPVAADAEQALAMIRSHPDGTVVDVRDEEEYITGHLADAVLLPVDQRRDGCRGPARSE